jgi:hypothetical protein
MSISVTLSGRIDGVRMSLRGEIDLATRDCLRGAVRSAMSRMVGVLEVEGIVCRVLDLSGVLSLLEPGQGHRPAAVGAVQPFDGELGDPVGGDQL